MPIRFVDAGTLPHPQSQTIYHAVAHARGPDTPDTIIVATPGDPYVCIGYHQDLEREVDVDYCRTRGLPIVRRELGGGAVYLDRNQLFVQWVMGEARLPLRIEQRFEMFARPIEATYATLGIDARFRPVNDIHVGGRKICGTGAAQIGHAAVLVGNFLFDFDTETMARCLRVPDEKFRDKVHKSLDEYMTTMARELAGSPGGVPSETTVKARYRAACERAFGEPLVDGALTDDELCTMASLDTKFTSADFLHQPGGLERPGIKIHEDVWVRESTVKAPGGLIRVSARTNGDRLEDVTLAGDFVAVPSEGIADLETALTGSILQRDRIDDIVQTAYRQGIETPGVETTHWVDAIMGLLLATTKEIEDVR